MALSGAHIACFLVGDPSVRNDVAPLPGKMQWSQTMASAGTTTKSARNGPGAAGRSVFQVHANAAIYVAIGASPDASADYRFYVPADTTREFYAANGDKLAWILA